MKSFFIHSMGCKSNHFEGYVIEENLISHGMVKVLNIQDADFYILNSCSVTQKSDNEAFYLLRNAKHKNPKIITLLTGCVAQIEKEKLLEKDFIDFIVGNNEKLNMYNFICSNVKLNVADIFSLDKFTHIPLLDTTKTRASLKIQDGCDNRCSYCIIPFARGKSRSAQLPFILDQINNFSAKGFKEVVFTGIHIGLWGKDLGLSLIDLLQEVEDKTDIHRYRLGSLNPLEITDELLTFLSDSEKFCPHFHLSLQSACNKTLKSMNRFYSVEFFMEQIDKINSMFDLPFLGSDIITGFAGETEDDFEITRSNLEASGLSQIHTFPYSIRPGTVGANLPEQVDITEKNRRALIIKSISSKKYANFIQKNIGKTHEVLIEKHPDKKDGFLKGITKNYITVHIDGVTDISYVNTLQDVKLLSEENGKIYGSIK